MKIIYIFVFLFNYFLFSKEVTCLVPKNIKDIISPLFLKSISHTNMKVDIRSVHHENTIVLLDSESKIKFAIVRRDILWQLQQKEDSKKKIDYIVISQLPYKAQLSLVQPDGTFDVDINMLVGEAISIGRLNDKNSYYFKGLLELDESIRHIQYKSMSFTESILQLKNSAIRGYFTFLPANVNIENLHIQTLFSKQTMQYFEEIGIFQVDYNGIHSPYILIASTNTDDEEIENMIYRLMEKDMFIPVTDSKFGKINQYVLTHLDSVKSSLYKNRILKDKTKIKKFKQTNSKCKKYHYGFLRLLREKPKLKKQLKNKYGFKKQVTYIKKIDALLIKIDKHKNSCDLSYLNDKKTEFLRLKKMIKKSYNAPHFSYQ